MWWTVKVGLGGTEGDGRRFNLDGEHTMQYTNDVLENCTLETYMILLINVTPINSIKKQFSINVM